MNDSLKSFINSDNDIKKISEITPEPRSVSEKKKLEKERLEYKKEVDKILRKWTIIYSSIIAVYSIAIIFLICMSWSLVLPGFIVGLVFPIWGLATTKEKCKELYKRVGKMKELDDRIVEEIRKQEILEEKY